MESNYTINSKNKWEIPERSGQFANRYALILNGHKVIVLEHYSEAHNQINKNIVDALNNYDSLLESLKNCIVVMERARNILSGKDGGNWGMLDTTQAKEAIKKAEQ